MAWGRPAQCGSAAHEVAASDALVRWCGTEEWHSSAVVECKEQSNGTPCAWQLEGKENFASALQRIEVWVNAGWLKSMGVGREPGAAETAAEVVVYSMAGTRAEWRGRLLGLARRARERQVPEWALGRFQRSWAWCYSSGSGFRRGPARSAFFFY
jgi:hypothetical protein